MLRYWHTLLENLVFLSCLMPLVGAALVAASARLGVDAIRRTAITNALLTLMLTVLMAVNFDPRAETANGPIQMSTSWRWMQSDEFRIERRIAEDGSTNSVLVAQTRGPNIRVALGVDGISLWFIVLAAVLAIPAMLVARQHDRHGPALCYAMLLLLQAALMGAFAALDVIFFLVCLEVIAFPLLWLIGRYGGYGRIVAARRFFVRHLAGTLLVACGLVAAIAAHSRMNFEPSTQDAGMSFDVRQLIFGGEVERDSGYVAGLRELMLQSEEAFAFWSDAGTWIFLALFAGFAILTAIAPCHFGFTQIGAETPTCAGVLLLGMIPALGVYGFARFVAPLFPLDYMPAAEWVSTLGIWGAIFAGLLALLQQNVHKLAAHVSVSQYCLAVAGIFSSNPAGMAGGIVLGATAGLSKSAMLLLNDTSQQGEQPAGFATRRFSRLPVFVRLAVIGAPGFGSFVGQFLVLQGLFDAGVDQPGSPLTAAGGLFAMGLVTWSVVRSFQLERNAEPDQLAAPHAPLAQLLAIGICLAAALWIGIVPTTLTRPMERSVVESVTGRPLPSADPDAE